MQIARKLFHKSFASLLPMQINDSVIIQNTIAFVQDTLKNAEGGHDWWHIYRVWKSAIQIAKEENVNIWACTDYDGIEEVLQDFINDKKTEQLRLNGVSRSTTVKVNEPFEIEEMGEKFEARINNYIDDNGLWDKRIIIVKVD